MNIQELLNRTDCFAANAGCQITEVDTEHAVAEMVVTEKHLNGANVCQGGALFTLADLAIAALMNVQGQLTVGINNGIIFVSSAPKTNKSDMRYRIKKETKPTLPTYGKYKAVAVHNQTIESHQLYEEAASRGMTISGGVLEGLMMTVADTVMRHLKMGDKVRLKNFGLFKLEIESEKVDNLKDFRAKKHIRGVRLHFIPESESGSPELYKGINFERDKTFKEADLD